MSNYKLAKFLGCSQTSVANWISGSRTPHDKARTVIADAFGLSLPEIDGDLPDGWEEIVMRKIKSPAPISGGGIYHSFPLCVLDFIYFPVFTRGDPEESRLICFSR